MHQLALTLKIIHYQLDENATVGIVIHPIPTTSPIPGVMLALIPVLEVLRPKEPNGSRAGTGH